MSSAAVENSHRHHLAFFIYRQCIESPYHCVQTCYMIELVITTKRNAKCKEYRDFFFFSAAAIQYLLIDYSTILTIHCVIR